MVYHRPKEGKWIGGVCE